MEAQFSWSNLLPELVEAIGKCLDTEVDVLRFRAVCKSWRSSRRPLKRFPCQIMKLPMFIKHGDDHFTLVERIVYRIQHPGNANFWLLKVERLRNDKLRILNPASHHRILPGNQMPKELNALDFHISEVGKAYALQCSNPPSNFWEMNSEYSLAKKVVYKKGNSIDDYFVMAIDSGYKLWYINSGDDKWTLVPSTDWSGKYVDLVNLRGQIYGLDEWGQIWGFDSMFEWTRFGYGMHYCSSERHLVESNDGKLHLVEKVVGESICTNSGRENRVVTINYHVSQVAVGIRIWTLNKRERAWGEAQVLNDLIIFAGDDCSFSVSSKVLDSIRVFYTNRCICFQTQEETDPSLDDLGCDCCSTCQHVQQVNKCFVSSDDVKLRFRGLQGHNTGVSDFATGKMGSLLFFHEYADVIWPPPSWLSPN